MYGKPGRHVYVIHCFSSDDMKTGRLLCTSHCHSGKKTKCRCSALTELLVNMTLCFLLIIYSVKTV